MKTVAFALSLLLIQGAAAMAQGNTQYKYVAPGDNSTIEQDLGPNSRDSHQSATSVAPGQRPNTIIQRSDGGSGNNQTAIVTGGGGNVVIQNQTGSGNRQIVTQTGSDNTAVQTQRGDNKTNILHQRGGATSIQD